MKHFAGIYPAFVLSANAFTIPAGFYWGREWLTSFAYHVTLDGSVFISTLAGSLITTLLIISFHTFRLATCNPVNIIRSE